MNQAQHLHCLLCCLPCWPSCKACAIQSIYCQLLVKHMYLVLLGYTTVEQVKRGQELIGKDSAIPIVTGTS